jgi:hypothetical protein
VGSQRKKYGRVYNRISFFELLPILKEVPIKEPPFGKFFHGAFRGAFEGALPKRALIVFGALVEPQSLRVHLAGL